MNDWTSDDVSAALTGLPDLEVLRFMVHGHYPSTLLAALGRASPLLRACEMHGSHRLVTDDEANGKGPLYANLLTAKFDRLRGPWQSFGAQ